MSLILMEKNNVKRLDKLYRFEDLREYMFGVAEKRNVIEVGHWVREIIE